jgi:hypothetical protein
MKDRVAILLDGGFVKKRLYSHLKRHALASDITQECESILQHPRLHDKVLFRVFFYDSPPFAGDANHPISGKKIRYAGEPTALRNLALLRDLDLRPDFAVRR